MVLQGRQSGIPGRGGSSTRSGSLDTAKIYSSRIFLPTFRGTCSFVDNIDFAVAYGFQQNLARSLLHLRLRDSSFCISPRLSAFLSSRTNSKPSLIPSSLHCVISLLRDFICMIISKNAKIRLKSSNFWRILHSYFKKWFLQVLSEIQFLDQNRATKDYFMY